LKKVTLQCTSQHTLTVVDTEGNAYTVPKGKTLKLLDAFTHEDDSDVAVMLLEVDGESKTCEVLLDHVMPYLSCHECV
jgi:hypothetical protein